MLGWIASVWLSVAVGIVLIRLFPSVITVPAGVCLNVGMAVAMGVALGWVRRWCDVLIAVAAGASASVLGIDALIVLGARDEGWTAAVLGAFDAIALPIAAIGLSVLLAVGATIGSTARWSSERCRCAERFAALRDGHRAERCGRLTRTAGLVLI